MSKPINHSIWVCFSKVYGLASWFNSRKEARNWRKNLNETKKLWTAPQKWARDY